MKNSENMIEDSEHSDGYYDSVPEGYHVRETLDGEELVPIDPELHTWVEDQGSGRLIGRSSGGGCATCDGGGCGECR